MTMISTGLTESDGRQLRRALVSAQTRSRRRAFLLVAPLLLFIVITFIMPIAQMLTRSVHSDGFAAYATHLTAWFDENPAGTPPDEAAYAALAADLDLMRQDRTIGEAATRINYTLPGSRSLFTSTARKVAEFQPPMKEAFAAADTRWEDPRLWHTMRSASNPYTTDFYLTALDRERNAEGEVVQVPEERRIYLWLFGKTILLSALITGLCLILAFPVSHMLATLPTAKSNLLLILVLLPFWTSLLVRTSTWIVILQNQGIVNELLVALGIVGTDSRPTLIYNQTGTVIVMTHVLLPFMILPLYSVMRMINPSYVRAARSLGASSWTAFRRIYLPQTIPGIGAGTLLVFILAVGYYITPALVGGADGQLISNMIAHHLNASNWSLAAALASMLFACILLLYWLYDRLLGIDKLKLG